MTQTINFTDLANGTLTIEDATISNQGLDTRYSVTFVGKNASGYAEAFNTNFLHLLENFASTEPPTGQSVRGQIWFDTSNEDVPVLRINNPQVIGGGGAEYASWRPASGVWPQSTAPASQQAGDIWVDTERGQLFINLDGTGAWTLVGPAFSSSLKTGSYPDTVNDSFGVPRKIIKNYVNDSIVEIISNDSFVPQIKIDGFTNILPGINVTTNNSAAINATAYSAKNLAVTTPSTANVSANNFVRNDIDNTIQAILTVKSGILVGADSTFNFRINPAVSRDAQIINSFAGGKVSIVAYNNTTPITLINANGAGRNVGIALPNNRDPNENATLEVGGNTVINGTLTATITTVTSLTVTGNTVNAGSVRIASSLTVNGTLFINSATISNSTASFTTITASAFNGRLFGRADTADRLSNESTFAIRGDMSSSLSGDVGFNGVGPKTYYLTATIQKSAVLSQPISLNTSTSNWTNFYKDNTSTFSLLGVETKVVNDSTSTSLVQIERKALLADLLSGLLPVGSIIPWAGTNNNPNSEYSLPEGWLLCDGQGVYKSQYPTLFNAIGYTYGQPVPSNSNIFSLPDLRGRSVIGYNDMNNGTLGLASSNRVPGANTPVWGDSTAASVAGGTSTVAISTGTASTGGGTIVNNTSSFNVMNPYLAMNYIIKV